MLMMLPRQGIVLMGLAVTSIEVGRVMLPWIGIYVFGIAVMVVTFVLELRNRRVHFDDTGFTVVNSWGRQRRFANTDFAATAFPLVATLNSPLAVFLAVGDDGRRILLLVGNLWEPEDQSALAESIGVLPRRWEQSISFAELLQAYPKAVRWSLAHPVAFELIIVGSAILGAVVALNIGPQIIFA